MNKSGAIFWKLSVRKKRTNYLLDITKKLVVKLWTKEIHINPNKAKMTRKKMKLGTFNEKPTDFLMET